MAGFMLSIAPVNTMAFRKVAFFRASDDEKQNARDKAQWQPEEARVWMR